MSPCTFKVSHADAAESFLSSWATDLNTVGLGEFFYVCGMNDGASHAWLEVDGLIVDITGDQFSDRSGIYVDKPDAWYGEWEEDTKHLAVHAPSAFFYGEERRFLERVLEHINRNEAAGAGLPSKLTLACLPGLYVASYRGDMDV